MTQNPQTPAVPGVPATRRQLLCTELDRLSHDPYVLRYALARALDGLDLRQLETLYDEVSFVVDGGPTRD